MPSHLVITFSSYSTMVFTWDFKVLQIELYGIIFGKYPNMGGGGSIFVGLWGLTNLY